MGLLGQTRPLKRRQPGGGGSPRGEPAGSFIHYTSRWCRFPYNAPVGRWGACHGRSRCGEEFGCLRNDWRSRGRTRQRPQGREGFEGDPAIAVPKRGCAEADPPRSCRLAFSDWGQPGAVVDCAAASARRIMARQRNAMADAGGRLTAQGGLGHAGHAAGNK